MQFIVYFLGGLSNDDQLLDLARERLFPNAIRGSFIDPPSDQNHRSFHLLHCLHNRIDVCPLAIVVIRHAAYFPDKFDAMRRLEERL